MTSILVIDDDDPIRALLSRVITLEGHKVYQASSIKEGLHLLGKAAIQIVIADVRLPDGNGIDLVAKVKQLYPSIEVIVLTAHGTINDGVKAIQYGAFDYLVKGEYQNRIIPLIERATEKHRTQNKIANPQEKNGKRIGFSNILGRNDLLLKSLSLAKKVSQTNTTVLLTGETGTGKEVFAQAIHYESLRKEKPFVAVNCSAFAKDLLESELFGHVQGAYTGATMSQKGLLEEAHEGTLFLDEIGEMSIDLQAKLLRVLETGDFYKVGESTPRHVDVRIIAATNRDLVRESETGHFRIDLYYRLSVFSISLPALRNRKEDIPILSEYFIRFFSEKTKKPAPTMSAQFLEALEAHHWMGNARELKNVIERCLIVNAGPVLEPVSLPPDFSRSKDLAQHPGSQDLSSVERDHIKKILQNTGNNKTRAAKILGIGLTTLYKKLKDYNI